MKLPDKLYDILKWIDLIALPALTSAYVGLSKIWGFPYAIEIAETSAVACVLIGALIGISTAEYRAAKARLKEAEAAKETDEQKAE